MSRVSYAAAVLLLYSLHDWMAFLTYILCPCFILSLLIIPCILLQTAIQPQKCTLQWEV